MVPVSSILVLGKACFGKMGGLVILFDKGLAVGEAQAKGGGQLNTEKRQALWLSSEDSWGGEWLIVRVSPAFLVSPWPMDLAPLLRSPLC